MKGKIITLVENSVRTRGLLAEHGLSFYLEVNGRSLLFDTGQSDILLKNTAYFALELGKVECIVLSHGHYDHTGGLLPLLKLYPNKFSLLAHPDAFFQSRLLFHQDTSCDVACPYTIEEIEPFIKELSLSKEAREIFPGVFTTGEIERKTDFEDVGGDFRWSNGEKDIIWDDQALVIDGEDGLIVLFGCGHSGLVNTLLKVKEMFPSRPIDTLIGGFHLGQASEARLEKTVKELKDMEIKRVIGGHCTGWKASVFLSQVVPFSPFYTGFLYQF